MGKKEITLEYCLNKFKKGKATIIDNGKIIRFVKEKKQKKKARESYGSCN